MSKHKHHRGSNEDKFWGTVYALSIIFILLLPCFVLWMWLKANSNLGS